MQAILNPSAIDPQFIKQQSPTVCNSADLKRMQALGLVDCPLNCASDLLYGHA